jgi:hypothetical protein
MDLDSEHQAHGVDQQVPLAAIQLLGAVVASRPPFSVVFTDWLSMIPALGSRFRPVWSRTPSRNASWIFSQVPSIRQSRT